MLKRLSVFAVPAALAAGLLAAPMAVTASARPHAADTELHLWSDQEGEGRHRAIHTERGDQRVNPAFAAQSARNDTKYEVTLFSGYDKRKHRCTGRASRVIRPDGELRNIKARSVACVEMTR